MTVKPIPEGFHTVTPYLLVKEVGPLIDFLVKAFGAKEGRRSALPDGTVTHADVIVGDSHLMMGAARGEWAAMPCMIYLYVPDTDAVYKAAMAAGATSVMAPADQFYGDRNAGVKDPFGNLWWIATHIEDVSPEELDRRSAEYAKKQAAKAG